MSEQPPNPSDHRGKPRRMLPAWFKVSIALIIVLIVLETLQLRIFVEVSFDGVPYLASLTDMRIWFGALGLLLVYILASWAWNRYFGSANH